VEELEAPELASPYVTVHDLLVGEQCPLGLLLDRAPTQHDGDVIERTFDWQRIRPENREPGRLLQTITR
jgi:hypothetical protein